MSALERLPFSDNIDILKEEIKLGNHIIPNRIAVQPMEGADGLEDGSPSELTHERYRNFAKSGAGLIWFEAVAVTPEAKASKGQLCISEENVQNYKAIVDEIRINCLRETGIKPIIIMQATHSGRYSKPNGFPEPIIAYNNPIFEKENPISKDRIITDERLKELELIFGKATVLAQKAGFDGIDMKCCHRYLCNELLSAYTREGEYGGNYENRTRFYKNIVKQARANAKGDFIVTSRLNIHDGFPYPYGFGVSDDMTAEPDISEAIKLVGEQNFDLLNITIGNPYVNPEMNRPLNYEAVERMYKLTKQVQDAYPNLVIISSAPTFMKDKSSTFSAAVIEQNYCKMVGFGRMSFAYPEFGIDIMNNSFDKKKTCVTCGKCTVLLRNGKPSGCVVRNKFYTELFQKEGLK